MWGNRIACRLLAYGKCRDPLFSLPNDLEQRVQDHTKAPFVADATAASAEECGDLDASGGFIGRATDSESLSPRHLRRASHSKSFLRRSSLQPASAFLHLLGINTAPAAGPI